MAFEHGAARNQCRPIETPESIREVAHFLQVPRMGGATEVDSRHGNRSLGENVIRPLDNDHSRFSLASFALAGGYVVGDDFHAGLAPSHKVRAQDAYHHQEHSDIEQVPGGGLRIFETVFGVMDHREHKVCPEWDEQHQEPERPRHKFQVDV